MPAACHNFRRLFENKINVQRAADLGFALPVQPLALRLNALPLCLAEI
jgi:hypothetical protein